MGSTWSGATQRAETLSPDDAWLIDFGEGWAEGWVGQGLGGTVAGDEQDVKRIMKPLGADEG